MLTQLTARSESKPYLTFLRRGEPMSEPITLEMMRQTLYSASVCDALDAMGLKNQSPRVAAST